ncbi:unnamed protein product [Cercopithifilaria johnstoni]|uniref:Peptidase C1A papain C-terminal domain-containing protein n=1 Tax=Cercopithifilaria johnstoni TaxID=2874296 RepID=A0A8J2LX80_9BILA|nr:unnamed protein product [Cercopithifilaria johnstoni]
MGQLFGSKLKKAIPRYVDYRKTVSKTPVIAQGSCRVCYIFAALSTLEMHIALKNKKRPVELSVQDVMDCSPFQKCYGTGGNLVQVFDWVSENGVMTSKRYPYKENDSVSCPSERSPKKMKEALAGGVYLSYGNENIIRRALAIYGPVTVSLYAYQSTFVNYKRGIYDDPDCPTHADHINHAVVAVGYGVKNGKKYFIIRNSWGATWGMKGYGYIRAGVLMCGIGHFSTIPIFL